MKHSQDEINDIWDAVCAGKFEAAASDSPNTIRPRKIVDDQVEQVISIPIDDGFGDVVYSRKPGGAWSEVPHFGKP
jgi:hypothetical protein